MTTLTPSTALPGLMQHTPLTLETIFERFRTVYADGRLVDHEYQTTYGEVADRILRLARVLTGELGVRPGDRVATFGHDSIRHFELYYAVPLVGAVLHTINVRLFDDQIVWIANHAQDVVLFADAAFLDQVAGFAPDSGPFGPSSGWAGRPTVRTRSSNSPRMWPSTDRWITTN